MDSITIFLDYDNGYNIVLGKHYKKLQQKTTDTIDWDTNGGLFTN